MTGRHISRAVNFMTGAGAAVLAAQLSLKPAQAAAKYTRYNVMSPNGQKMLASYAKGVEAMLKLPADDPRNWFRNAFIHLMDCPHGNWWFYVWHRGYLGYFEQTIRKPSGDANFALPVLGLDAAAADSGSDVRRPADADRQRIRALYGQPRASSPRSSSRRLRNTSDSLSVGAAGPAQHQGLHAFDKLWNDVTGFSPTSSGRCRHFGKHGLRDHLRFALSLARQPEIRQGDRL